MQRSPRPVKNHELNSFATQHAFDDYYDSGSYDSDTGSYQSCLSDESAFNVDSLFNHGERDTSDDDMSADDESYEASSVDTSNDEAEINASGNVIVTKSESDQLRKAPGIRLHDKNKQRSQQQRKQRRQRPRRPPPRKSGIQVGAPVCLLSNKQLPQYNDNGNIIG